MGEKAKSVDCWEEHALKVLVDIRETNSARDLRDALLLLAYELNDRPDLSQAVCVLLDSRLSEARAIEELSRLRSLVPAELAVRLHVLFCRHNGRAAKADLKLPESFFHWLNKKVSNGGDFRSPQGRTARRSGISARHAVIVVLYENAMSQSNCEGLRIGELQRAAGVSYPTVVAALQPLIDRGLVKYERGIVDFSALERADHLMQLRDYANSRKSRYFVDPSGVMRPVDLVRRLKALRTDDARFAQVRLGGVIGASHYFPKLDITAPPRLDLEVPNFDIDLVRTLDVGLEEQNGQSQLAVLAVHPALKSETQTRIENHQLPEMYASTFDCLADLVDIGYAREAIEMVNALMRHSASKA